MMERIASDLTFILLALIVAALLGFIIGWLLRGGAIKLLNEEIASLKIKLNDCEKNSQQKSRMGAVISNYDAAAIKAVFGKNIIEDDLKIVEGIGPVIEGILNIAGINTWKELSITTSSQIRSILYAVDEEKFRIHDPGTWPDQAGMAFRGEWKELFEYQEFLDGGKIPG
jgi:predicted flap endonuclease-1-like 5' DNA nuclease